MTLDDLIRRFRVLAKDNAQPYLWAAEDVTDWLNDAQRHACVRGRLLVAEGDQAMCQIALTPGKSTYPLHRSFYELIHLRIGMPGGKLRTVALQSREWLDTEQPDWRDNQHPVCTAIQTDAGLRLVGSIATGDVLHVEAYRLPLKTLEDGADKPEIHEAHHEHLIQWALHKAFSIPDAETFDANRAALAEVAFTRYFGALPDSDMRRTTRHDVPHHNVGVLP